MPRHIVIGTNNAIDVHSSDEANFIGSHPGKHVLTRLDCDRCGWFQVLVVAEFKVFVAKRKQIGDVRIQLHGGMGSGSRESCRCTCSM